MLFQRRHQCVTHLVIGHQPLFHVCQNGVLLLRTGNDRLEGHQQVFLIHQLTALAHSPESSLIDQIGKVSAHRAGRGLGDLPQVHIVGQPDLPGVYLQRIQPSLKVGLVHDDPAVEPAGTEQCLVQNLGAVGRRQTHDALGRLKAVDLAEQLVERLLLLGIVPVAVVPGAAHGVDLINKDDAGRDLRRLLEQVTDTACAHAHEHLHKVRTGNGEEGDVSLARHSLGQQRFAGAGRTHQQRALGQLRADGGVLLGIVEEIDDLLQGFFGLVLTGHVLESDAGLLFHVDPGLGLSEAAHHAVAAHTFGEQIHHQEQPADHQGVGQNHHDQGIVFHDLFVHLHPHGVQLLGQGDQVAAAGKAGVAGLLHCRRLACLFLGHVDDAVGLNFHLRQLPRVLRREKVRKGSLCILALGDTAVNPVDQQNDRQRDQQRGADAAFRAVSAGFSPVVVIVIIVGGVIAIQVHSLASFITLALS